MTGARLAVAQQLTDLYALKRLLDYTRNSVPGAFATLAPSQVVLTDLADAKPQETFDNRLANTITKDNTVTKRASC